MVPLAPTGSTAGKPYNRRYRAAAARTSRDMTGSAMVSVPESVIQDIGSLKQSHHDLRRSIDDANSNTRRQLAAIEGRLASVSEIMQTVAQLVERQNAHGNGLDRAFTEIEGVKEDLDEHVGETVKIEKRLSVWYGLALGIAFMSAATTGMFVWSGKEILAMLRGDIEGVEAATGHNDKRLDRLERIEARHHGDP